MVKLGTNKNTSRQATEEVEMKEWFQGIHEEETVWELQRGVNNIGGDENESEDRRWENINHVSQVLTRINIHAALTLKTDQKQGNRGKMDRCHKVLF